MKLKDIVSWSFQRKQIAQKIERLSSKEQNLQGNKIADELVPRLYTMADYNNHSRLLAEKRLLALAALEVVRRHDVQRMNELKSQVLELTAELDNVRNERDETRAEMVRRGFIQLQNIWSGERTNLHPGDEQEFAAGTENRHPADDVCALAMAVQQITTRMTELCSHIDELNDEPADVTYERDKMRRYLDGGAWGRFRLLPREMWSARQARERAARDGEAPAVIARNIGVAVGDGEPSAVAARGGEAPGGEAPAVAARNDAGDSNVVTDERPTTRRRFMLGVMGPLSLPVCSQSTNEETL